MTNLRFLYLYLFTRENEDRFSTRREEVDEEYEVREYQRKTVLKWNDPRVPTTEESPVFPGL